MTATKISLSIEDEVLSEARIRAGRRELSAYVSKALRRQLQQDRLGELLELMEAESGSIPDEIMEEARQVWRSPDATRRRRHSA